MNMGGFLFSFICLWCCGWHLLAPRHVRALGGQIPAQNTRPKPHALRELPFPLPPQQEDATQPFPAILPTKVHGDSICTPAAPWSCNLLGEGGPQRKTPLAKQGRLGPHPASWSFPTSNQAKLYFTKARAGKARVPISQAALGCARWCIAQAEQLLKLCLAPHQSKIRPRILHTAPAWAKMFLFSLPPPLPWSKTKSKQKTPCRDG